MPGFWSIRQVMMMSDSGDVAAVSDHLSVKCILDAGHVNRTEHSLKPADLLLCYDVSYLALAPFLS